MRDLILQYVSMERQIRFLERGRITEVLKHKKDQHEEANQNIREVTAYRQRCLEKRFVCVCERVCVYVYVCVCEEASYM